MSSSEHQSSSERQGKYDLSKSILEEALLQIAKEEGIAISLIEWGEPPVEHPTPNTTVQKTGMMMKVWAEETFRLFHLTVEEFEDYQPEGSLAHAVEGKMRTFLRQSFR